MGFNEHARRYVVLLIDFRNFGGESVYETGLNNWLEDICERVRIPIFEFKNEIQKGK